MGKLVFWIVVFFAVLFVLRLANVAAARKRDKPPGSAPRVPETMVKCVECGVYLPREEAETGMRGYRCKDGQCERRKAKSL